MSKGMKKPVKVTLIIDWADERARIWFGNMTQQVSHRQYLGVIDLPEVSKAENEVPS